MGGTKRVELRRRCLRNDVKQALIYASAPRMALVAKFRVETIIHESLGDLWTSIGHKSGVTKTEFDTYFHGLDAGFAIGIADLQILSNPISLSRLRSVWPGFHPPQGYRYLSDAELVSICLSPLTAAA